MWALWDKALSSSEMSVIKSNPRMNLNEPLGSYNAGTNLMHFWRFGADEDDIGRDWARASANKIDLHDQRCWVRCGLLNDNAPTEAGA